MRSIKVAALVGSLRAESINLKLVLALTKLAGQSFKIDIIPLADLPMYNEDLFTPAPPAAVSAFKNSIAQADAVLFAMPEYNRSVPAVLKNAIDWGSRPYGSNVWAGKPASIVGSSPGAIGSAVGQSCLRSTLVVLEMELMGQPEVCLRYTDGLYNQAHDVLDDSVRLMLEKFINRFDIWIERFPQRVG